MTRIHFGHPRLLEEITAVAEVHGVEPVADTGGMLFRPHSVAVHASREGDDMAGRWSVAVHVSGPDADGVIRCNVFRTSRIDSPDEIAAPPEGETETLPLWASVFVVDVFAKRNTGTMA